MADIRLTSGNDTYTQSPSDKETNNTLYGEAGDDTIRLYQGAAFGSAGNDRIERIVDEGNAGRGLTAAYWDAKVGIVVNLAEGWAEDGLGGRDVLVGVTSVLGNSTDDRVIGDARDNGFGGNHGHDYFDGGDGIDTADLWFSIVSRGFGIARLDDVDVRVSADGLSAKITPKVATGFSLTLVNVERIGVLDAAGQHYTIDLASLVSPQVLAEDAIAAGGNLRWNATQALGTPTTISFSFVVTSGETGFRSFSASERQAVRDILAMTERVVGLSFTEVEETGSSVGQLRFGISQQFNSKGFAALPGTQGERAGDVWMDTESMQVLDPGSEGYAALLHEIGHALGLRHPRNADPGESWPVQVRVQDDRPTWSVMSSVTSADGLFRADWGLLDVAALRHLYGPRRVATGDDTYRLGQRESSAQVTVIDDGGQDTIDASGLAAAVRIDLTPGHLGSVGLSSAGFAGSENLGMALGTVIENVVGTAYDDVLLGNLVDNLITGGPGNDWMDGGSGTDTAVFALRRHDVLLLYDEQGRLQVEARDGRGGFDTLMGIERLQFADQVVSLAAGARGADGSYGVDEDTVLNVRLPGPVGASWGDVRYALTVAAAHGNAQVTADGWLTYTAATDFAGSDVVGFDLSDGQQINRYYAYIAVNPVNDGAPVGKNVHLVVAAGATLEGMLPKALDADGDRVSYAVRTGTVQGDVTVSSDGSFRYAPKLGYSGSDQFTYIVSDGAGGANTYTAVLDVMAVATLRRGTEGPDLLEAHAGGDGYIAGGGNDRIIGGGGLDVIDGGSGIDTAVFSGLRAGYRFSQADNVWRILATSGTDGTDVLTSIERIQFSDTSVALDLDGHAGATAQIIRALFGRESLSNKTFVGLGLQLFDAGTGYADIVKLALATDLFAQLAGDRSHAAFVKLVYQNVMDVPAPSQDLAYFVGLLDSGTLSQSDLAVAAAQFSANAGSVDLVGLSNTGLAFTPAG